MARNLVIVPHGECHSKSGKLKKVARQEIKQTCDDIRKAIETARLGETAIVLAASTKRHKTAANMLATAFVKATVVVKTDNYEPGKTSSDSSVMSPEAEAMHWRKATPAYARKDSTVVAVTSGEYVRRLLASQIGFANDSAELPKTLSRIDDLKGIYDSRGEPVEIGEGVHISPQALIYDFDKTEFVLLRQPGEQNLSHAA